MTRSWAACQRGAPRGRGWTARRGGLTTMLQVLALEERFAPATRLKLASLVLGGAFLGLRVAWADNPVIAAGVIAGVLGLLGLLRGGFALASRRRVARVRESWPGSAAVSASVNVAAMLAPGSPPARRGIEIFTVTVLLLPDRLILVPGRWTARRGGIAELHLPLDHVRSASWLTDDAVLRQIPVLQLTGESGDPVMIRFGVGPHPATADFIAATRATLARWLPATALTGNTNDPVNPTHFLGVGVPLVVAAMVVSIMGGYVAGAVVITRAKSSPALSSWIGPDRAIGVPGYYTYGGPHRKPIQLGAPFGRPCKPIVVRFEDSVPAAPYSLMLFKRRMLRGSTSRSPSETAPSFSRSFTLRASASTRCRSLRCLLTRRRRNG
jgi:hypothetical protein